MLTPLWFLILVFWATLIALTPLWHKARTYGIIPWWITNLWNTPSKEGKSYYLSVWLTSFSLMLSETIYAIIIFFQTQQWEISIDNNVLWQALALFIVGLLCKNIVIKKLLWRSDIITTKEQAQQKIKHFSRSIFWFYLAAIPGILGLILVFRALGG